MAGKRRKGIDPVPPRDAPDPSSLLVGTLTVEAPPAPPAPTPVPVAPASRPPLAEIPADLLAWVRDHRRIAAVLAAVLAVVVVGTGLRLFAAARSGNDAGSALPRRAILLSVDNPDNSAVAGALLVTGGQGSPAVVLVPPGLIVDVAGFGSVTFAEAGRAPASGAQAAALADALGISVAGTWRISTDALAALVDAAGGVTVPTAGGRIDGRSAVGYLARGKAGEPQEAVAARLRDVLGPVLAALPDSGTGVAGSLSALGKGSRTDLPPVDLAASLAVLSRADSVVFQTLPLRTLDNGGPVPSVTLDRTAANSLVKGVFAEVAVSPPAGGAVRVLVQNGVGTPGLGEGARAKLVSAGLVFVNGGNATRFDYATSVVLVPSADPQAAAHGAAVAKALGLPATAVQTSGQGQNLADVVVVLGRDYRP